MDLTINIKRLDRIDKLITKKQTGSPPIFAERIDISEATLYRYLRVMKILGAPIVYDQILQSYIYERNGTLKIHFCELKDKEILSKQMVSPDH